MTRLQRLLYQASVEPSIWKLVLITLEDRKVYAGWVMEAPNLRPNEQYLRVLPLWSGYRQPDDLRITRTTDYPFRAYFGEDQVDWKDLVVVLPLAEVTSARFYDPRIGHLFID